MKVIEKKRKFCFSCMEEHAVETVQIIRNGKFRDVDFEYTEIAEYCDINDELSQNEGMIRQNAISFKDAYRKKVGLLTSQEIIEIRNRYGFSQGDLSRILGWGEKTITRYESHQIQDPAHNDLLRLVADDPKWLLGKIKESKGILSVKAYEKYINAVSKEYSEKSNSYIIDSIESEYTMVGEEASVYETKPNLNKVAAVINYIAAGIDFPYLTRMMKLLWYSDALSYKRSGKVITGLVYTAEPMGALPIGYRKLLGLDDVEVMNALVGDGEGILFISKEAYDYSCLSDKEKACIDTVMERFRFTKTLDLIDVMHGETAYKNTKNGEIISFDQATELSLE